MGVWIEIASETELDLNYLDPVMLEQVFLAVKYRFDVGKKICPDFHTTFNFNC